MLVRFSFLALVVVAASLGSAAAPPIGGDFERAGADSSRPDGWFGVSYFDGGDLRATFTWDDDIARRGRRSLAITLDPAVESSEIAYNWTTSVEDFTAGATYALGGWVRAADLTSPVSLILQCWNQDSSEQLAFATTQNDYPVQGAEGLRVTHLDVLDGRVSFRLNIVAARFSGELVGSDRIEGRWRQGMSLPLTLTRLAPDEELPGRRRPQDPRPPYPYTSEDVTFDVTPTDGTGPFTMAGTVTLPAGAGPHPAVLLIADSGPQDRDSAFYGHRPFLVLADHLTRRGLAVLRVDERGVGRSTGDRRTATTEDFVTDALAGVRYLRSRVEIDPDRVGIVGHSEGGFIAPLTAVADPAIAAIVLMAAPGVPGRELPPPQRELILAAAGATREEIAAHQAAQRTLVEIAIADLDSTIRGSWRSTAASTGRSRRPRTCPRSRRPWRPCSWTR